MIPKIIWQTHELPYHELPSFQKDIIDTWIYLNPGWEHRYVDSEMRASQVREYDEFLYSFYNVLGKVHQADIWRLVVLYEYGGVYADMDSVCIKPIDHAIGWNYKGEEVMCSSIGFQSSGVNNSNFGAIKNSRIIKFIIDSYILEYMNYGIKKLPKLNHGDPENSLFSQIIQKTKKLIYFNNEYFNHSQEYKTNFDIHNIHMNHFDNRDMLLSILRKK